jgi:uncharacterized protein YndB with AHSA1/START domain
MENPGLTLGAWSRTARLGTIARAEADEKNAKWEMAIKMTGSGLKTIGLLITLGNNASCSGMKSKKQNLAGLFLTIILGFIIGCAHSQPKQKEAPLMEKSFIPDLSSRPHSMTLELQMKADAASIFNAWTRDFDLWFAEPGELIMTPEENRPFFFYNRHDWGRHAHYGRFVKLEKDKLIEMTWLTGKPGTYGAETVIRIELTPQESGTAFRMTHSGFEDEAAAKGHKDNWPLALEELDQKLISR